MHRYAMALHLLSRSLVSGGRYNRRRCKFMCDPIWQVTSSGCETLWTSYTHLTFQPFIISRMWSKFACSPCTYNTQPVCLHSGDFNFNCEILARSRCQQVGLHLLLQLLTDCLHRTMGGKDDGMTMTEYIERQVRGSARACLQTGESKAIFGSNWPCLKRLRNQSVPVRWRRRGLASCMDDVGVTHCSAPW